LQQTIAALPIWVSLAMLVGVVVWTIAIILIVASPKFRRKWLWFLLSLLSFGYSWYPEPGVIMMLALPCGATYIMLFYFFGPSPRPKPVEPQAS